MTYFEPSAILCCRGHVSPEAPRSLPASISRVEINSVGARYDTAAMVYDYHDRVRAAIAGVPGVENVAIASQIPMGGNVDRYGVHALDKPLANPEASPYADRYSVSHGFLPTMGVRVIRGRDFLPSELRDTLTRVALVSDAIAKKIWGDESPVGKLIRVGAPTSADRRVVGLVSDLRHEGLDRSIAGQVYLPERQFYADGQVTAVVRVNGDPAGIASSVRRAIHDVDPTQAIARVATMDQLVASSVAQRRFALVLFAFFATTALLLAIAGIYGLLAGRVAERTREIGLRTALGAAPTDIVRLVAVQGGRLAAAGLVIGLVGALALGELLRSMLFGVSPRDPLMLGLVTATLGVVTIIACIIPARRALRVDPMEALRAD